MNTHSCAICHQICWFLLIKCWHHKPCCEQHETANLLGIPENDLMLTFYQYLKQANCTISLFCDLIKIWSNIVNQWIKSVIFTDIPSTFQQSYILFTLFGLLILSLTLWFYHYSSGSLHYNLKLFKYDLKESEIKTSTLILVFYGLCIEYTIPGKSFTSTILHDWLLVPARTITHILQGAGTAFTEDFPTVILIWQNFHHIQILILLHDFVYGIAAVLWCHVQNIMMVWLTETELITNFPLVVNCTQ